jgi:chromosome segregation ATPase
MMGTPPEDNLADDDLDITAKLPILSSADIVDAPPDVDDATGEYRPQLGVTAALPVDAGEHLDLMDELVSVRDRIVSLETALADTEVRLTRLQASHDSLQSNHADLLVHSEAVSRARDHLAEERLLWLANRQQLQDQLEQQRVEAGTALLNLQQSLEQQQRTDGELHRQLTEQRAEAEQLRQQHTRQISDLSRQLEEQRQHGEALQTELLTAQQQFAEQHASAAALARSMAQGLLDKDDLQRSLATREQRIAALESRLSDTSAQLASAVANGELLVQSVATHQQDISERARQTAELQRELTARQAEIDALQDELSRAVIENDGLGQQLAERNASLNARQEVIASQDRELLALQEARATLMQREATLLDSVMLLREELEQLQLQLQQRDQLALEKARALDGVNSANRELTEQIRLRDQSVVVQAERIATLSATVQRLQDESARQDDMLEQVRWELAAKQLEQGASARQVEALQVELHQHVEAMQAIRRDIHQVALQTRKNEGETLLRTLTRDDAEGVVHLLSKSSISIGRGSECDIQLQSGSVSRYHAVLRISHDAVIFEDMNSTNGCFVNGRRIKRQLLKDGDRLKVGAVPLRFGIRATQD